MPPTQSKLAAGQGPRHQYLESESGKRLSKHKMILITAFLGDSGVGKSTAAVRRAHTSGDEEIKKIIGETEAAFQKWTDGMKSTIGVDIFTTEETITVAPGKTDVVKMTINDTAGQERFRSITRSMYAGAQIVMLCFSIDNPTSFKNVKEVWYPDAKSKCDPIFVLVGLKADLKRKVPLSEAKAFAELGKMCYYEASALRDPGSMDRIFSYAAQAAYDREMAKPLPAKPSDKLDLKSAPVVTTTGCC